MTLLSASAAAKAPTAAAIVSIRRFALFCIGVLLLIYVWGGYYRYQQLQAEADRRIDRSLRIAREHALKVFDTNEALVSRMEDIVGEADRATIVANEKALHEQLQAISKNRAQIQSMYVLDANGKMLVRDRTYPAPAAGDASDRLFFKWHQAKKGGLYISEPLIGKISKERLFDMSRGRYNRNGDFEGVVSVSLLPSYFENFHKDLSADESGIALTMFREDGMIMSRWPPLQNAPDRMSSTSSVMARVRAGDVEAKTIGISSLDGRRRLLMYSKLPGYPIYVGIGKDLDEITSQWLREMAWLAAFALLPIAGLAYALRVSLRRTRDATQYAHDLNQEAHARRRVEEALFQAQKLEAMGRLTGGVAHDFNNALMVISNNLHLIKRKFPEANGPQVASIGRAIESATRLTRQLLAFSRKQALVAEQVSLQEKLPPLKDLMGPVVGSQIALAIDIADDTAPIMVDSAELELALLNLAINSRDAMPAGGRFTLDARNADGSLPPLMKAPMVVITATDTGAGVDPAIIAKVFDPFFTTKPVGEGTGLGLSQIYGLCERAGGTATIESVVGSGTTVRLFFPAVTTPVAAVSVLKPAERVALNLSLLMVEDNDDVAAALQAVLEDMGCTVTRLDRGAAGRDWLNAQTVLPQLLLTDVVMPGEMDGIALAKFARETFPSLPVLLMTGYAEQLDFITGAGFEVVPKPSSPEQLAESILKVTSQAAKQVT
ncbi:MAG: ATP-binding protein [Pseudomonadota bacterium]